MLRQQADYGDSRPNQSLADYVAPAESGLADHVGAFAVAIHGADELARELRGAARRLQRHHGQGAGRPARRGIRRMAAPAGAPRAGTPPTRTSATRTWSRERYRGIRPAFGYPACPDHSEKQPLFALLDAGRAGLELTESYAMSPAAAVSGLYFAHPEARYFSVGRVGHDQLEDYAPGSR